MKSEQVMRDHGKTFFWATTFIPKEKAEDIYTLYAFCRFVDDLVDVRELSCKTIIEDLENQESEILPVKRFLSMTSRRKMSLEPAKNLVNTLENDRSGQRIESWRKHEAIDVPNMLNLFFISLAALTFPHMILVEAVKN